MTLMCVNAQADITIQHLPRKIELLVHDRDRRDTPLCWHRATKAELNTLTQAFGTLPPHVCATILNEERGSENA